MVDEVYGDDANSYRPNQTPGPAVALWWTKSLKVYTSESNRRLKKIRDDMKALGVMETPVADWL
ncbi:hypothetical protein BV25DRAFT_1827907 [Artomyces pyxidatus]|uniref:Uncharacterized protein n=1 Tax=Artomyces pyxidatus TaxID=48021 RepID=A0ACB8SUY5_9AGAM|nr:hypothetical protein BV25DRAFT_1827907 [Artomyces pyxidatus]